MSPNARAWYANPMPGQDGGNSRTQPQEPRSNGAHGPSAHALNALRAALDNPSPSRSQRLHQHLQQPQNSGSHAPAVHRDHSPFSRNNNSRHSHDEQLSNKDQPVLMRASYSVTPIHIPISGAPLRATIGGHADLQSLNCSTRESPTMQRFSPPLVLPPTVQLISPQLALQAPPVQRYEVHAEMLEDVDMLVTDDPVISDMPPLTAPASTPTLRNAPSPPSDRSERAAERRAQFMQQQQRGGHGTAASSNSDSVRAQESRSSRMETEIDKGPLGIVFSHTCSPTSSGNSIFNMHKVTNVLPGSIADRCGLRSDDLLMRVNGIPVDTLGAPDLRYHFGQITGTCTLEVEVMRMSVGTTQRVRVVLTRAKGPPSLPGLPDYLAAGLDGASNEIPLQSLHDGRANGHNAPPSSPRVDKYAAPLTAPRTSSSEKDPIIQEFKAGIRSSPNTGPRAADRGGKIPNLLAWKEEENDALSDYVVVAPVGNSADSRTDLAVDVGKGSPYDTILATPGGAGAGSLYDTRADNGSLYDTLLATPGGAGGAGIERAAALPWTDQHQLNGRARIGLDESMVFPCMCLRGIPP